MGLKKVFRCLTFWKYNTRYRIHPVYAFFLAYIFLWSTFVRWSRKKATHFLFAPGMRRIGNTWRFLYLSLYSMSVCAGFHSLAVLIYFILVINQQQIELPVNSLVTPRYRQSSRRQIGRLHWGTWWWAEYWRDHSRSYHFRGNRRSHWVASSKEQQTDIFKSSGLVALQKCIDNRGWV
jgi:hypothetical protein